MMCEIWSPDSLLAVFDGLFGLFFEIKAKGHSPLALSGEKTP